MNVTRAKTADEALALAAKGARVLAGGTDLFVDFKKNGRPDADFVDISGISEWKKITETEGGILIGALVTFADLTDRFDKDTALYQAAYNMGSPQIRNRATIVGNIVGASPAADAAPVLLALGAKVVLRAASGERMLPIDEFFIGYRKCAKRDDEIVTGVMIPNGTEQSVFRKIGLRNALAISVASLAAAKSADGLRLAMGSVAEKPVRLTVCEALAEKKKIIAADLKAALRSDIRPITDVRASAEYRAEVAYRLLTEVLGKEYGYEFV